MYEAEATILLESTPQQSTHPLCSSDRLPVLLLQAEAFQKLFEAALKEHSSHPCMLWAADISKFEKSLAALHNGSTAHGHSVGGSNYGAIARMQSRPRLLFSDPELECPAVMQ
jgi:hypothetical protein